MANAHEILLSQLNSLETATSQGPLQKNTVQNILSEAAKTQSQRLLERKTKTIANPHLQRTLILDSAYISTNSQLLLPAWQPSSLGDLNYVLSLDILAYMFQSSHIQQKDLGKQIQGKFKVQAANDFNQIAGLPKEEEIPTQLNQSQQVIDRNITNLLHVVFEQNNYNIQKLKLQELCLRSQDLTGFCYEVIPAYLLDPAHKNFYFPLPPFDARIRLLSTICLLQSRIPFKNTVYAYFLSNRVIDMIETAFWLTHAAVFAPNHASVCFSDLIQSKRIQQLTIFDDFDPLRFVSKKFEKLTTKKQEQLMQEAKDQKVIFEEKIGYKYTGKHFLPEHLNIVGNDLNAIQYLTNRLADDFACLTRTWAGCQGDDRTILQELLPYFISQVVIKAFYRCFPTYSHVFTDRFKLNIYYNFLFALTGLVPYTDIMQSIIFQYFGDDHQFSAGAISHYIPHQSKMMGQEADEKDLQDLMMGLYTNRINRYKSFKALDESGLTLQQYISENQLINIGNTETQSAEIKAVEFDFVLFQELIQADPRYDTDVKSQRITTNYSNQIKQIDFSLTYKLLTQSVADSQNKNTQQSIITQIEREAGKAANRAVPRSTLQVLDTELISRNQQTNQENELIKKRKIHGLFQLEPVTEIKPKYQKEAMEEIRTRQQQVQKEKDKLLSELPTKPKSTTIGDTLVVRMPERLHLDEPHVTQVVNNEIVTNNDRVFEMHGEYYQHIVNSALSDGRKTAQLIFQESHIKQKQDKQLQMQETSTQHKKHGDIISALNANDGLLNHPLRVTKQKINTNRGTPLLQHYLKISGAPYPSQFKYDLQDGAYTDPKQFTSTNYQSKQSHLAGGLGVRSPTRVDHHCVASVQRTRGDVWARPEVPGSERVSPNRFYEDYLQKRNELAIQQKQDSRRFGQIKVEIATEKQLFMNPSLKGQQSRMAALAKTLTEPPPIILPEETMAQQLLGERRGVLKEKLRALNYVEKVGQRSTAAEKKRAGLPINPKKEVNAESFVEVFMTQKNAEDAE